MQPIGDRTRRLGRRHDHLPAHRLESRHAGLGDRWDIGISGHSEFRRDAERADLAGRKRAGRRPEIDEHHWDMAGDHIVERRQAAAVRHIGCLESGHALQHLHIEMVRHARPNGGKGELARIGLGVGDQLRHRLHRQAWIYNEHEWRLRKLRERNEIDQRIVGQALIERDVDRHGRRRRHQQRVTVRVGLLHVGRRDDRPGAGLVLDHEAFAGPLLQLLRQQPRQQVGAGAGRERIDDGDGSGRIVLRDRAGGQCDRQRRAGQDRCGRSPQHCDASQALLRRVDPGWLVQA